MTVPFDFNLSGALASLTGELSFNLSSESNPFITELPVLACHLRLPSRSQDAPQRFPLPPR